MVGGSPMNLRYFQPLTAICREPQYCISLFGVDFIQMEHGRDFYVGLINVIDYLTNPNSWDVFPDKGEELAGNYWPEIGRLLSKDYHAGWFENGRFHISNRPILTSLREDCAHTIERIDKAEQDRNLSNQEKIENISYGRKAYMLAENTAKWNKRSIIFTCIVASGQIIQWIILIIQWLSNP